MKKIFRNAVWAVVMVLCTVLVVACNKYDLDEDEIIVEKEVKQTSCVTVKNTYKGIGVSISSSDPGTIVKVYKNSPASEYFSNISNPFLLTSLKSEWFGGIFTPKRFINL